MSGVEGVMDLVRLLAERGHRRFGFLGDPGGAHTDERLAAYWAGVDAAEARDGSVKHGRPLTPEQLRRWVTERRITAVLVEAGEDGSNVTALESVADEVGVDVPGDLSVAVLGDPPLPATRDWTRVVDGAAVVTDTVAAL